MKHITRIAALALAVSMLSVAAFAAPNYTPSVEQKETPQIVAPKTEHQVDGKPAIVVKDENGEVKAADAVDTVKITGLPTSKKDNVPAETLEDGSTVPTEATEATEPLTEEEVAVQESLEKAYNQIAEAKDLSEVAPELPKVLEDLKVETPVEELVVQDLFNITLPEEMTKALEIEGNTIDISFQMEIEEGKQLIVMVQTADGQWVIVSGDAVVVNDDGTVTISFPCVGNVAFIVA